jgi:hypothetical protein
VFEHEEETNVISHQERQHACRKEDENKQDHFTKKDNEFEDG